jgi:hypothetical protein
LTSAPPAQADETNDPCVEANGKGQELCREGLLSAARDQFLICAAASSCPPIVRDDCTRRFDEADKAQPTLAFEVRDANGNDLSVVHITMDGTPRTDVLDGKPLPADPGRHLFVIAAAGHAPVSRIVILRRATRDVESGLSCRPRP